MIKNRKEAGKLLAVKLKDVTNPVVLAIPRGGVIVGNEIAEKLDCPLDVAISKKITPPNHPEFAIGAITHDGTTYQSKNWECFSNNPSFQDELDNKKNEVQRRLKKYRGNTSYKFDDKTIIVVDDGIATGSTVFAIFNWLSKLNLKRIILAVPVMPRNTYAMMKNYVLKIIFLEIPDDFSAVGQFYEEFAQVSDDEVLSILSKY